GLALCAGGSHLLARLYELEPRTPIAEGARGSACCSLVRQLFHRNHGEEPLYPTSNRSLPAAHLSPSLHAAVGALALSNLSGGEVHKALRAVVCSETKMSLPLLARETGVSIARFERLVESVRHANEETELSSSPSIPSSPSSPSSRLACLPHAGSAMLMKHLWLRSAPVGQGALSLFLLSLQEQAIREELSPAAVHRAAGRLFRQEGDGGEGRGGVEEAEAFEVMAAALALGGSRSVPLLQGRYGYKEQSPVADCSELVTRELLNALLCFYALDGPAQHERAQLRGGSADSPPANPSESPPPEYTDAARKWFEMVSGLPRVHYLAGIPSRRYEMAPTIDNILICLGELLGVKLQTIKALQDLWREVDPERGVQLSLSHRGERLTVREADAAEAEAVSVE
ncbi:MAG: hypothetical protein SGPRY_003831, partial [Prymnesium sp.]